MRYEIEFDAEIRADNIHELNNIIDEILKSADKQLKSDTDFFETKTIKKRPFAQKSELLTNLNKQL